MDPVESFGYVTQQENPYRPRFYQVVLGRCMEVVERGEEQENILVDSRNVRDVALLRFVDRFQVD